MNQTHRRVCSLIGLAAGLFVSTTATGSSADSKTHSLDGIVLGSNIQTIIAKRGMPSQHDALARTASTSLTKLNSVGRSATSPWEYFYEAILHFSWNPPPFGDSYADWRGARRKDVEEGREIYFLGSLEKRLRVNSDVQSFACKKVWEGGAPVLHVCHDSDGAWQFLCGGNEHTTPDVAVVLHARHMFDLRPELAEVADLEPGSYASRNSVSEPWTRYKNPRDDSEE